jgi:hypothetical protein
VQFTRGAAVLAAAALLTTGLAACGEDEPVEPTSSTTVSPLPGDSTTSPSSTASGSGSSSGSSSNSATSDGPEMPSDLPEAAREETKEGAAAFGKYYFIQFGEATRTGDTSTIEMLDSADCLVCRDGVENINEDTQKGWTRSKNPYSVTDVQATKRPDEGFKVSMQVKVAAHKRLDSKGQSNGNIKATRYTLTEHVVWVGGKWQILDWIAT